MVPLPLNIPTPTPAPDRPCASQAKENSIVLSGLGVPDFLCHIENLDQQILQLSVAPAFQEAAAASGGGNGKAAVRINGLMLRIDERMWLQHFDVRILLGSCYCWGIFMENMWKRCFQIGGGIILLLLAPIKSKFDGLKSQTHRLS